jgi:hypothetical protein
MLHTHSQVLTLWRGSENYQWNQNPIVIHPNSSDDFHYHVRECTHGSVGVGVGVGVGVKVCVAFLYINYSSL